MQKLVYQQFYLPVSVLYSRNVLLGNDLDSVSVFLYLFGSTVNNSVKYQTQKEQNLNVNLLHEKFQELCLALDVFGKKHNSKLLLK